MSKSNLPVGSIFTTYNSLAVKVMAERYVNPYTGIPSEGEEIGSLYPAPVFVNPDVINGIRATYGKEAVRRLRSETQVSLLKDLPFGVFYVHLGRGHPCITFRRAIRINESTKVHMFYYDDIDGEESRRNWKQWAEDNYTVILPKPGTVEEAEVPDVDVAMQAFYEDRKKAAVKSTAPVLIKETIKLQNTSCLTSGDVVSNNKVLNLLESSLIRIEILHQDLRKLKKMGVPAKYEAIFQQLQELASHLPEKTIEASHNKFLRLKNGD